MEEEMSMQGNLEINKKDNYVLISVNPKIYPVDVVLSSAYIFTDSCYVLVDGDPHEEIIVELRPKDKKEDVEKIGRDFNNELVNYANYAVQAIKNSRLREAILNRVLLTNSVQAGDEFNERAYDAPQQPSEPWEEADKAITNEQDIDDPLEIAKPWEEKYGKKEEQVKAKEETPNELKDEEQLDFEDPEGIAIPWEEKYGKDKDKQKKE